jgi:hypothetical protein
MGKSNAENRQTTREQNAAKIANTICGMWALMSTTIWLRQVHRRLLGSRRGAAPARHLVRPRLEALEERLTPATFNVTPTGAGLNSLSGAIAQANLDATPDTIVLAPGQYNLTPHGLTDQLVVTTTHALTIEGTGSSATDTVIDASQIHNRAFLLNAGTNVTFQNLTIQHGVAVDDGSETLGSAAEGGGILDVGGNVTLSNAVVQDNSAQCVPNSSADGGGIFVQDGSLTINDSIIRNNKANATSGSNAGALGGGVFFNSATGQLNITRSTLTDNIAQGGIHGISG